MALVITAGGLGLTACGSGGHTKQTAAKPAARSARTGISRLLLATGEESGYAAGTVATYPTLTAWDMYISASGAEERVLTAEGFVSASSESIGGFGDDGGNFVEEFRSAAGAHAEVAADVTQAKQTAAGAKVAYFRVPGVPTARGIVFFQAGEAGTNAYWSEGRCTMFLGNQTVKSRVPQLTQAIQAINRRTGGTCP